MRGIGENVRSISYRARRAHTMLKLAEFYHRTSHLLIYVSQYYGIIQVKWVQGYLVPATDYLLR